MRRPSALALLWLAPLALPFLACGTSAPPSRVASASSASGSSARLASSAPASPAARCEPIDLAALDPKPGDEGGYSERVSVSVASDPKLTCEIADDNIRGAEDAVLAGAAASASRPAVAPRRWDHRTRPKGFERVDARFHLSKEEQARLDKLGFVVSERLVDTTYSWMFHELYQSQMPLYVSSDAIFHAVYASNDKLIESIETARVSPLLGQVLATMQCQLASDRARLPADVARDLDLYLTVARSLLADASVASELGVDAEAATLVAQAKKAGGLETVTLFGRSRAIDFGAYKPRGHYAGTLAPFFRAAMWLSRVEFNLVSRSCRSSDPGDVPDPSETPREAVDALALAELAEHAGALPAIDLLDRTWGLLAGPREDVSVRALVELRKQVADGALTLGAAPALKRAIGDRFRRRAQLHRMPEGTQELPAIATLLGPRVVPDAAATRPIVNDQVPGRGVLRGADVAYLLGHDRAKEYLKDDLATYPNLGKQLDVARAIVNEPLAKDDLYSAWFGAVRALARPVEGTLPSFASEPAFQDLRIDGAIAAFGQIRHNYVLIAGQGYDSAGCEIPDAYVDPVPEVYAALVDYAERGDRAMRELDPKDVLQTRAYFARLARTLKVLRTIALDELAGRALTPDELRFLSMVAEYRPPGTGGGPTYTGWYFELFRDRTVDGLTDATFVADDYTSASKATVSYVGATAPRLGIFVVDTGGEPRVVVGPVARAFETTSPLDGRLTDADARDPKRATSRTDPWAASYTAAAPPAPPLAIAEAWEGKNADRWSLRVASTRKLGPVTIELLDHHRVPFAKTTATVGAGETRFRFSPNAPSEARGGQIEAVHVTIGSFDEVLPLGMSAMGRGSIDVQLGGMKPLAPLE
jgi:hypothetical protein